VVLYAASHGVPPDAYTSHGPDVAAEAFVAVEPKTGNAIETASASRNAINSRVRRRSVEWTSTYASGKWGGLIPPVA
jgi:hypothetical protein